MGFDLQYTQKSLPERAGSAGPMQVDTGRHEIVRNIASGGENLSSAMVILNRLQAENQLAESTAMMQEEFDRLEDRIQKTADTTQYDQFLKETLETSRTYSPKNRLARRMYDRVMRQAEVYGKNYVMDQQLKVEREKKRAIVFSDMAAGNFGAAISALNRGVQDRSFDADEAAKLTGEIMELQQQAQLKSQISTLTQIALTKSTKDESLDAVRDIGLQAGLPSSAITFVEGLVRDDWNREDEKRQEYQNEVQHNIIAKIRGGDKTVIDDIEKLSDPGDKEKWYKAFDESTKGDLPGNPIIMGQLKKKARLIARGAVKPTDFESDLLAEFQKGSLGRGEKAGRNYDEILTLAQTKYESWQDAAIHDAEMSAYDILQVGEAANMWQEIIAAIVRGETVDAAEQNRVARLRVLRAYNYDRWRNAQTDWIAANPKATANEIRDAGVEDAVRFASRSLEEIEREMKGLGEVDYVSMAKEMFGTISPEANVYEEKKDIRPEIAAKRGPETLQSSTRKGPISNPAFTREFEYDMNNKETGIRLEDGTVLKIGDEYTKNGWRMKYLGEGKAERIEPVTVYKR